MKAICSRRIHGDICGATAIEYAIIAGLIGLGLVGSLAVTRDSLSENLNTVSEYMISQSNDASGTGVATAAIFDGKTLTYHNWGLNAKSQRTYIYQYSDGSSANYARRESSSTNVNRSYSTFTEPAINQVLIYYPPDVNYNGAPLDGIFTITQNYSNGNIKSVSNYTMDSSGVNLSGTIKTYSETSRGTLTGTVASTALTSDYQPYINQYNIYKANP